MIEIIFQVRTQESKGLPPQISTEDFLPRFKEFRRFEDSFADCLSKTAVKTKFAQHAIRGEQVKWNLADFLIIKDVCFTRVYFSWITYLKGWKWMLLIRQTKSLSWS